MKLLTEITPMPGRLIVAFAKNNGTGRCRASINHCPRRIWPYQKGRLVNGLLTKHAAIAEGTFTFARIAKIAAKIDCGISGIIEKNKPIANPEATVSRQGTHKLRWKSGLEIFCHHGRWRSFLWRSARKARRTIRR
jgi:hypothetical protein